MLGNLYENAIEASLKIEDTSKRYIRIEIACMEGNLIISFFECGERGWEEGWGHMAHDQGAVF